MNQVIVFAILFGLLFFMAIGSLHVRYLSLLVGTILFPLGISFLQSPTLRPMDLFLYGFFAITILKDYKTLSDDIKAFPLKIPLLLLFISHFISVYFNEGFSVKQFYAATRELIELYGYIFASFFVARHSDTSHILHKVYYFVIVLCIFGILEVLLQGDYPYTYICRAFPIYSGYYSLDDVVSSMRDYRIRVAVTTAHPTAYGTLLTCFAILFASLWNKPDWNKSHLVILYALLAINLFVSGSRTGMACTAIGLGILFIRNRHALLKIACIGTLIFSTILYINVAIDEFSKEGQGSTLSMRQQQLLFTFLQIQQSPIVGNGVGYTKNVFDYDDDGRVINDESIGGLESIVYRSLIDYGFIGLGTYYFFALWFFIVVFKKRNEDFPRHAGYTLILTSTLFFTLSGHIGNNTAFAFLFEGLMLGQLIPAEDKIEVPAKKDDESNNSEIVDAELIENSEC